MPSKPCHQELPGSKHTRKNIPLCGPISCLTGQCQCIFRGSRNRLLPLNLIKTWQETNDTSKWWLAHPSSILGQFQKCLGFEYVYSNNTWDLLANWHEYEVSQNNRHTAAAGKACWDLQGGRPRCKLWGFPLAIGISRSLGQGLLLRIAPSWKWPCVLMVCSHVLAFESKLDQCAREPLNTHVRPQACAVEPCSFVECKA